MFLCPQYYNNDPDEMNVSHWTCFVKQRCPFPVWQVVYRAYERPRPTDQGQWKFYWACRFWNTTARFAGTFFKLSEALVNRPSKIFTGPGLLALVFHKPWSHITYFLPHTHNAHAWYHICSRRIAGSLCWKSHIGRLSWKYDLKTLFETQVLALH